MILWHWLTKVFILRKNKPIPDIYSTLSIKAEMCFAVLNYRAGVLPLSVIQLPRYDLSEYIKYEFGQTVLMIKL